MIGDCQAFPEQTSQRQEVQKSPRGQAEPEKSAVIVFHWCPFFRDSKTLEHDLLTILVTRKHFIFSAYLEGILIVSNSTV